MVPDTNFVFSRSVNITSTKAPNSPQTTITSIHCLKKRPPKLLLFLLPYTRVFFFLIDNYLLSSEILYPCAITVLI